MSRLEGKGAFITGAGAGIARATAVLFAREGARVVVADIDAGGGEETAHRVAALTRSLAVEFAAHKVRVNAIAPSATMTERVRKLMAGNAAVDKLARSHLLGLIEPEDIASAALYLASDESRMMTGHILRVDSGVTIS